MNEKNLNKIENEIRELCKTLKMELSSAEVAKLCDSIGGLEESVIGESWRKAQRGGRKIVSQEDVIEVLKERKLSFLTDFIEPAECEHRPKN